MAVVLTWATILGAVEAGALTTAGLLLGLGPEGAAGCCTTLMLVAALLGASVLPVMWAATRWRGYLAGIGLTLVILVVANLAAGFGLGSYVPWSVPIVWVSQQTEVSTPLLATPSDPGTGSSWAQTDRNSLGTTVMTRRQPPAGRRRGWARPARAGRPGRPRPRTSYRR